MSKVLASGVAALSGLFFAMLKSGDHVIFSSITYIAVYRLFNELFNKKFGVETVLATWLVHDGYGFSAEPKVIDLDGYKAYWMEKHIYLIEPGLSDKGISALFDKFETEGSFNPGNVVVFGYSFSWTQLEALKNNLLKIAANGTNKHVLLDKRY